MKFLNNLSKQGLTHLFALFVLFWTASQTYSLLVEVTGSYWVALWGIVLFEGGALSWLHALKNTAEGAYQMVISGLSLAFDLLLILAAVAVHLGAFSTTQLSGAGSNIITVATIINLLALFLYEVTNPEILDNLYERATRAAILQKAYAALGDDSTIADAVAQEVKQALIASAVATVRNQYNIPPSPTSTTPALPSPSPAHSNNGHHTPKEENAAP
jgi:hypothetical protein